jgi:cytochrome b-561 domain containing protein 2
LVFTKQGGSIFKSFKHSSKITLHWIFNVCGLVCIVSAFLAIYQNKNNSNKPHFKSWHGLIGITTICYTIVQIFAGHFLTVLNSLVAKMVPYKQMAKYHSFSGMFLFCSACVSMCLGVYSNWFTNVAQYYVWLASYALIVFFGITAFKQVANKYMFSNLDFTK